MDVKACTKQRKRRTKEKQKEHTFPLYLLTHYSIYYLSRIQFLAKGCTNTGWLYTPSLLIQARTYTPRYLRPFGVSGLVPFSHCDWLKVER
ncbi:hypothetical protein EVAR_83524_1 [Eumeta japonica]|uniref:Uncharacterized protein n=1 Tax=Eumeta variegata TaxID=151549 RepID=A0A4C1ZAU1_EUMVA|nr:hypothetical protein EVAR_83524_1 [Eumeta japonica]